MNDRAVSSATRNDDSLTYLFVQAQFIANCECIPLRLENVNVICVCQVANDERRYFYTLRMITPRAVFYAVMRADDGTVVVHRKRDEAVE